MTRLTKPNGSSLAEFNTLMILNPNLNDLDILYYLIKIHWQHLYQDAKDMGMQSPAIKIDYTDDGQSRKYAMIRHADIVEIIYIDD